MLTIMAAFAQLERDTMVERTRVGLWRQQPMVARADTRARSTTPMLRRPGAARQGHHGYRHREKARRLPRHRVSVPIRGIM